MCEHHKVSLIHPTIEEVEVEGYVIIRFDKYCEDCKMIVGTERERFSFEDVIQ